jgi:glyoxylase-like metal-dependent hydrolase (beta-lactamase superfamily II)
VNPIALNAGNPGPMTGDGNWTWLIDGRLPALIDAGVGETSHLDAIARTLGAAELAQVIVTHAHGDHASGAPAVQRRFPGTRFFKSPWPERDSRWQVRWEQLSDGDVIDVGDTSLSVVATPGHAPDHIALWHVGSRTLFGGDLAIKGTTVYIPASHQGDLAQYMASLERVIALQPLRLLPAHGDPIDDPVDLLRRYLRHRREREQQVLDGVMGGMNTPEALVSLLYRGLSAHQRPRAIEMVAAHLVKLERDGRLVRRNDAWHMIEG